MLWPFIDIVQPQLIGEFVVMRREGIIGQIGEALFGSANDSYGNDSSLVTTCAIVRQTGTGGGYQWE